MFVEIYFFCVDLFSGLKVGFGERVYGCEKYTVYSRLIDLIQIYNFYYYFLINENKIFLKMIYWTFLLGVLDLQQQDFISSIS